MGTVAVVEEVRHSRSAHAADSPNLDYLRSVAVLCVLADHVAGVVGAGSKWLEVVGRIGVLIFFVHTSLVLMLSLERSYRGGGSIMAFYLRRAFRIYPLVGVCTLAAVAFRIPGWPLSHPMTVGPGTFLDNLLLIQNLTLSPSILLVSWSLPYEVQMYVALPFLFLLTRRSAKPWLAITLCLLPVLVLSRAFSYAGFARMADVVQFAPCFLAGILAFTIPRGRQLSAVAWILGLPAILIVATLLTGGEMRKGIQYGLCILLGLLIPFFHEIRVRWLKESAHLIAKYSYGIYLSHLPAMWLAFHLSVPWQRYLAMAVLLVTLPVLLYHLIEEPMIRYGKALVREPRPLSERSRPRSNA